MAFSLHPSPRRAARGVYEIVVGVGDFNGDGYADVLWFNLNSGALVEWLLDGQGNVIATPSLSLACGSGCSPSIAGGRVSARRAGPD
jgi:hypothetical protein